LSKEKDVLVGGQAIIEGVMMRSPDRIAMAVRKPDGKIALKSYPYISLSKRSKFWGFPIIRGAVVLIESMVIGVKALTFSGDIAVAEEQQKQNKKPNHENKSGLSNLWLIGTVIFSLAIGLALFFYLPLVLTDLLGAKSGFWFNVVDGALRLTIFMIYLGLITLWKDIRRIFEYHGAEHKTVFAYEDGKDLTIENAKQYTPYHPRCGTSFLLTVLVISVFVFMLLGRPETIVDRLIRLAFVPLIGGISYEAIKLSDKMKNNPLVKLFIKPGLWLQKITAREPDESMLEVALVALQGSLGTSFTEDPRVVLADDLKQ